ncbi:MAG: 2OG-Fe(II) oxygenase [Cyanobacteria bacterium P01_A01_bin.84]
MHSLKAPKITTVRTSYPLAIADLFDLLNGKILALRIPSYYPLIQAEKISRELIREKNLERYHRAPDVGVQRTGTTFFETNGSVDMLENYYQKAPALIKSLRYACGPYLSPIDKLRLDLGDMWLAGCSIENVHNRTMLAGIGRVFEDNFELPPHQDILSRDVSDTVLPPSKPFEDLISQLSANIYLRTPETGGELEIWNAKPSTQERDNIRDREYQYEGIIDRASLPKPTVVIQPEAGELILFDSGKVHAVRPCKGGPRVSMSIFIGYRGQDKSLTYWS